VTTQATIYIDQGTDFLVSLELSEESGFDFVITNQSFFCDVRKLYSTNKLFSAELNVISNGDTNQLDLYISPEKTRNLTPGKYQYDVLMVENSGAVQKILEGLMIVLSTITEIPGNG
jgi:hypothetical protein